jgi:chromosome partitioning protein
MLGRVTLADATPDTNVPGVQLVPAAPSLDGDMVELSKLLGPEQRLKRARADVQADVVFIDCPGSISPFTI